VSDPHFQAVSWLAFGGQIVLAELVTPIPLGLQILEVVVIHATYVFDLLNMGDTQCGQIFLLFRVVG
jgi:hypothetical protein